MAKDSPQHNSRQADSLNAELECLHRLRAVRNVLDAFLAGHWALDSALLLVAVDLLDQAGAWAMVAEEADRRRSAA